MKRFENAHRLAFLYMEGYFREVSISCNNKNCNIYKSNTSGITGVHFYKKYKKWLVYIVVKSKTKNLGYFDNFIEAVKARWEAEVKYKYPDCNITSSAYIYLKKHGVI